MPRQYTLDELLTKHEKVWGSQVADLRQQLVAAGLRLDNAVEADILAGTCEALRQRFPAHATLLHAIGLNCKGLAGLEGGALAAGLDWASVLNSLGQLLEQHLSPISHTMEQLERMLPGQDDLPEICKSISAATAGTLHQVALRTRRPLVLGAAFPQPPANFPAPPSFQWPKDGKGVDDELAGYGLAKEWWVHYVLPPGVKLVMASGKPSWLACAPAEKVVITGGGTDGLLVLAEHADKLEQPDIDVLECLLFLCGQVEFKTVDALKLRPDYNQARSQAGLEHICATFLQEHLIANMCQGYGKEMDAVPERKFRTILTDNNKNWAVYMCKPDQLMVVDQAAGDMAPAATAFIKAQLAAAAAQQREVIAAFTAGGSPSTAPPGGGDTHDGGGGGSGGGGGGGGDDRGTSSHGPRPDGDKDPEKAQIETAAMPGSASQPSQQGGLQHQQHALPDLVALARTAWQQVREDEELLAAMGANYSEVITSFLRSKPGYKDLLGLDAPPSTIQLPDVETLLTQPLSEQPRLICAAMQQVLAEEQLGKQL